MPKRTQGAILSRDQIVINTIKADIGKLFKIDFSKHGMFKEPETGAAESSVLKDLTGKTWLP